MANFSSELTGAFFRLEAKRSKLDIIWRRFSALEENINQSIKEQDRLRVIMDEYRAEGLEEKPKYAGQPCPQDQLLFLGPYVACHRYAQ